MSSQNQDVSKFLSYVLRHQPESIGLALDREGWANIDSLVTCAAKKGKVLDRQLIKSIVENSDKKRFSISDDGCYIRAAQGHSSKQVDINYEEQTPPQYLYHGTATRFIASIHQDGLISGSRQYVHLSADIPTATTVGQRHGKPVVLTIDALAMYQNGFKFYRADNGVWLTASVPVKFIVK